jgi:hypothetical protein
MPVRGLFLLRVANSHFLVSIVHGKVAMGAARSKAQAAATAAVDRAQVAKGIAGASKIRAEHITRETRMAAADTGAGVATSEPLRQRPSAAANNTTTVTGSRMGEILRESSRSPTEGIELDPSILAEINKWKDVSGEVSKVCCVNQPLTTELSKLISG